MDMGGVGTEIIASRELLIFLYIKCVYNKNVYIKNYCKIILKILQALFLTGCIVMMSLTSLSV